MSPYEETYEQSKGESRYISYLIKPTKDGQKSQTRDIFYYNTKSVTLNTRPRLAYYKEYKHKYNIFLLKNLVKYV